MPPAIAEPPFFQYFDGPVCSGDVVHWSGTTELELMWINERGPGRGISVEVWGPAVDAGLIEVLSVEVQQGPNTIGLDIASHVASSGECVLVADAPQLDVYAAADWNASATQAEDIGRSMLTTRIVFRTAKTGHGLLSVGLVATGTTEVEPLDLELHTAG